MQGASSSSAGVRSSQPPPDTLRLVLRGRAESSKPSRYRGGRLARVTLSTSDGRVKDLRESAYFFFRGGTRPAGRGNAAARFLSAPPIYFLSARSRIFEGPARPLRTRFQRALPSRGSGPLPWAPS